MIVDRDVINGFFWIDDGVAMLLSTSKFEQNTAKTGDEVVLSVTVRSQCGFL